MKIVPKFWEIQAKLKINNSAPQVPRTCIQFQLCSRTRVWAVRRWRKSTRNCGGLEGGVAFRKRERRRFFLHARGALPG